MSTANVIEPEAKEMHDRSQRSEAIKRMIDELSTCFANIRVSAQSLDVKMRADGENPIRKDIEQMVKIAERVEEQLSFLSEACALLAESTQTVIQSQSKLKSSSVLSDEELPIFFEYVRRKHGVVLEEDLVTMVEDLIERQKQRFNEKNAKARTDSAICLEKRTNGTK